MEDPRVPLATSDTLSSATSRAPLSRGGTFEFHECLSRQGTCDLSAVVEIEEQSGKKKAVPRPGHLPVTLEENLSEALEDLEATSPSRPRDIQDSLEQKELKKEMKEGLGHRLKELPSEGDLTSTAVVLPCGEQGWSLPVRLRPEQVFRVLHFSALICLVYGISWSVAAVKLRHLPTGKAWFFCPVVKLGYPMIPVIIGCWMKRCRTKRRMTPGYYFANLKMPLMASLGPGVLIGALGDTVVLHLCGVKQVIGRTYSAFILSFAWLTTCLVFWLLQNCIIRKFASDRMRTEIRREDWGFYSRVLVELEPPPQSIEGPSYYSKKWEVHLRPGIAWTLGFIPAPRHGTFHSVSVANKLRCISITIICGLIWCMLIIAGHSRFLPDIEVNSVRYLLIHTDMHNLIMNAVTAPYLIIYTWRSEPDAAERGPERSEPGDQNGRPWVFFADERAELQAILDDIKKAKGEGGQPSHRSASSH